MSLQTTDVDHKGALKLRVKPERVKTALPTRNGRTAAHWKRALTRWVYVEMPSKKTNWISWTEEDENTIEKRKYASAAFKSATRPAIK